MQSPPCIKCSSLCWTQTGSYLIHTQYLQNKGQMFRGEGENISRNDKIALSGEDHNAK